MPATFNTQIHPLKRPTFPVHISAHPYVHFNIQIWFCLFSYYFKTVHDDIHIPLIAALVRQRQVDCSELEASLTYIVSSRPASST